MTKIAAATCAQISALPWAVRSRVSAVGMLVGPRPELGPISWGPSGYLSRGIYSAHTPRCAK